MASMREAQSMARYSSYLLILASMLTATLCMKESPRDKGPHVVWASGCSGISFVV